MKETYEYLKETEVNYLTTINGDKPSCRPFCAPVIVDNLIYILTSKHKNVSKQISKNNNVCIVTYSEEKETWMRINCQLIDDNNINAKKEFLKVYPDLEESGYNLEDPDMQVMYMSNVTSIIYDEDGNELIKYNF